MKDFFNQSKRNWYPVICCSVCLLVRTKVSVPVGLISASASCKRTLWELCEVGVAGQTNQAVCLCGSSMCCTVNTLKDPYHPCVWWLEASHMSGRQTLILMGSIRRSVISVCVYVYVCVRQDVCALASNFNLQWIRLDPAVFISSVLPHEDTLCWGLVAICQVWIQY